MSCEITRKGYENQQLSGPFHLAFEFLLKVYLFQLHWVLRSVNTNLLLLCIKFHETHRQGACERYAYRSLEFINAINDYIKCRLLKAMSVSGTGFTDNLTIEPFVVIINSKIQTIQKKS